MTREEAIAWIKSIKDKYIHGGDDDFDEKRKKSLDMAVNALEQEDVLNKIKTEIIDTLYIDSLIFGELIDFKNGKINADDVIEEFNRVTKLEVLKIFEKYKAESEV